MAAIFTIIGLTFIVFFCLTGIILVVFLIWIVRDLGVEEFRRLADFRFEAARKEIAQQYARRAPKFFQVVLVAFFISLILWKQFL